MLRYFAQRNPKWAGLPLGADPEQTIGKSGCLLCCHAGLLGVEPPTLNERYLDLGRFSGALINSRDLSRWGWELEYESAYYAGPASAGELTRTCGPYGPCVEHLRHAPAILLVDSTPAPGLQTHFVLADAALGDDVHTWDPWYADFAPITPRYGRTLARAIYQFWLYSPSTGHFRALGTNDQPG